MFSNYDAPNGWRWYVDAQSSEQAEEMIAAGEGFLSVTTILDIWEPKQLKDWRSKTSAGKIAKTMSSAANTGTLIHDIIQKSFDTPLDWSSVPETVRKAIENWQSLKSEKLISASYVETPVVSNKYGFAGRVDFVGTVEGERGVADIKTGYYSTKAGHQIAAYKYALEESGKEKDLGMYCFHVHRDGIRKAASFKYEHHEECWLAFLSALNLFRMAYYNELKKLNWRYLNVNPLKTYFEAL